MSYDKFEELWMKFKENGFECVNSSNIQESFKMLNEHAIRFSRKNEPVPNIEFKIIKDDSDKYSFENKLKVIIRDKILFISPLELQIAYKLFLAADGTDEELKADKDIEDARHLYQLFKDKINKEEFHEFLSKLNVKKRLRLLE
jgi:hypothetical protein